MKRTILLLSFCLLFTACKGLGQGSPVTPQRPTFSSDTNTTPEGTVEVEAGMVADPDDIFAFPAVAKFGMSPKTEAFLGWTPLQIVDQNDDNETGTGDVLVGVRHRILELDKKTSVAVQGAVKLPTADENRGLGTGEIDASFAGIITKLHDQTAITGYYQFDFLGDPGGDTNVGHGLAIAASRAIDDKVGLYGELAEIYVPELDFSSFFGTFGLTYTRAQDFVIDAGILVGLSNDAPDAQILIGMTRNLGRIR